MYYNLQLDKRNRVFTYRSDIEIEIGTYCIVDFSGKEKKGVVVDKFSDANFDYEIKEIKQILDEKLDKDLFELIKWVHSYYLEPYGSLIPLIEKEEEVESKRKKKEEKITEGIYDICLNTEQEKVVKDIENSNDMVHLINGVTGSGKTEVYITLVKNAMEKDFSSIILVPEIALTTQLCDRLQKVFGDKIAIWHSKLSKSIKAKYYAELESGQKKVVLGARSAIFCKVKNLKYIIIDEEHENTYKQEESPRYHAKNVSIKRAIIQKAKVILGSATPSFETMYQVKQNIIKQHKLEKRYNNASLPEYIVHDLTEEKQLLSEFLINKINEKLEKNEQIILLLNRKAYSIMLKCKDCKKNIECDRCTFNLTYYKQNLLKCNQCGLVYKMIKNCKYCNSVNLLKIGTGTEKLEEQLKEIFDENRILRMDADSMNTKTKLEQAYKKFLNKEYSILVGTQILAKGFHFPDVTLVCVVNADQMSNFPDYKVNENVFQLITQASGRAGRGQKKGEVLIQTYNKESSIIKAIVNNDYNMVYEEQMNIRKLLFYPPYSKHIKILITDTNEKRLTKISQEMQELLYSKLNNYAKIYPVSNAFVYKIAKRYRNNINIIFDRKNERKIKAILANMINNFKATSATRILVDVDPSSML